MFPSICFVQESGAVVEEALCQNRARLRNSKGKEDVYMLILSDILNAIASVLLIFSSVFYFRHLHKTKRQRKLTPFELTMYIVVQLAYVLFAISLLIGVFFR